MLLHLKTLNAWRKVIIHFFRVRVLILWRHTILGFQRSVEFLFSIPMKGYRNRGTVTEKVKITPYRTEESVFTPTHYLRSRYSGLDTRCTKPDCPPVHWIRSCYHLKRPHKDWPRPPSPLILKGRTPTYSIFLHSNLKERYVTDDTPRTNSLWLGPSC